VVTPPAVVALPRQPVESPPPARPSPRGFDLRGRLRDDWQTIRRSFQAGEDDFRRALDDTKRNFRDLVGQ
jgi:hypothetical protein